MARSTKVLVVLILCCSLLCGCSMLPDALDPIVLTVDDLTITMPGYYENYVTELIDTETGGYFVYGYSEITITGLRDSYEVFDQVPTLEGYANKLIQDNEITAEVEMVDGLTTFTYRQLQNSDSYTYSTAVYAGTDAFWMVTAGCKTLNFDAIKDKLVDILKTVVVA